MCHARTELGADHAAMWGSPHLDREAGGNDPRPRVLVEIRDGAEAWGLWRVLERAGYAVSWCPGPDRASGTSCPLVTRGACPLVEDADVVLSALGPPIDSWRAVLEASRRHHPDTPVVVGSSALDAARLGALPMGSSQVRAPLRAGEVLRTVEDALALRRASVVDPVTSGDHSRSDG